jgi:hypothetical protein
MAAARRAAARMKNGAGSCSTLSHELRTPLNVIMATEHAARGGTGSLEDQQLALDRIQAN